MLLISKLLTSTDAQCIGICANSKYQRLSDMQKPNKSPFIPLYKGETSDASKPMNLVCRSVDFLYCLFLLQC